MGQQNRHYQRLNCQWSTINDDWLGRIMHLLGFNNHQHSTFNLHKSSIGFSITHVFSCLEVPRQVRCELCSTDKNSSLSVFIFFFSRHNWDLHVKYFNKTSRTFSGSRHLCAVYGGRRLLDTICVYAHCFWSAGDSFN